MSNFHDFLIDYAKFPFPIPKEDESVSTTDVSSFEVGLLEKEWKATLAVRDDALVEKLCSTLSNILGDTPLNPTWAQFLLEKFLPRIQFDEVGGGADREWLSNPSEVQSRVFLDKAFLEAARRCLRIYNQSLVHKREHVVEGGSSKVDYLSLVDEQEVALIEAKSPSVMKNAGELLPHHGIHLTWIPRQSLLPRLLSKIALCLGLRKMEWAFLSCHNYWIVCRLVKDKLDNDHPYLVYSKQISIKDSSEPFRAYLGAILSVVKGVSVEPSEYNPALELDLISEAEEEEESNDGPYENGDDSGLYVDGSSSEGTAIDHQGTRLTITSSSPNSPKCSQLWVPLHPFSNNTLSLPQCAKNGKQLERLWLTHFIAACGSTGSVWRCQFDNSNDSFAIKIVEVLCRADAESRQRIRNEFNIYLTLEKAYQSGQLSVQIAPHCYGAFKGHGVDGLILDLCDGVLKDWDDLTTPDRGQIYNLVKDLHNIGIVHDDLEPRNIVRILGGNFRLIDFSQSRKHVCVESKVDQHHAALIRNHKCPELEALQKLLWPHGSPFKLITA